MTDKINLKELEKKAYRFSFKDGIYDTAYGVLLLSFAIAPIIREIIYPWYILILVLPAPLILIFGKKYLTIPRIGVVKFDQKRRKTRKKMVLMYAILVPITILVVILTLINMFPGNFGSAMNGYAVPVGAGIFAIVILSLSAYLIDFPNMYIYGIIIGFGIPIMEILQRTIGPPFDSLITFGVTGIILLIIGLTTLIRFIQKYPIPRMETKNEE